MFQYFFNLNLNRKQAPTKTTILPKAGKINFHYAQLELEFQQEKADTKTKILPKAGKINFQYFRNEDFQRKTAATKIVRWVLTLSFEFLQLIWAVLSP